MRFCAWWPTRRQRKKRTRHGGSVFKRPKDRTTDQTPGVRLRDGARGFLLRYHVRTGSGLAQVSYAIITRNSPPEQSARNDRQPDRQLPHIGRLHGVVLRYWGSRTARSRITNRSVHISEITFRYIPGKSKVKLSQ
jgi:hypothetical protein